MRKTLIFVDSIDDAVAIARYLRSILPGSMSRDADTIIRCYFAELEEEDKELYIKDLRIGKTLLLICTEACGMGMDVSDIELIVQWKLSSKVNLRGLCQRLGRAGRDPRVNAIGIIFIAESQIHDPRMANENIAPATTAILAPEEELEETESEDLDSTSPDETTSNSAPTRSQEKVPSRFNLPVPRQECEAVHSMVKSMWAALEKEEKDAKPKTHRSGWLSRASCGPQAASEA